MEKYLFTLFVVMLVNSSVRSQDANDRTKPLTSDELFLKQNGNKNITGKKGQKYLVLDFRPGIGKFRRYRFFVGDQVRFRIHNEKIRFKSVIAGITDSSFTITNKASDIMDYQEIPLKNLRLIKVSKRIPFVTEAAYYFPMAGLLYIGADFVNKGTDGERFSSDASAFIVGGALMAAGFVCYKLSLASIKVNDRNKLKVMETY
ncbi:hypothetical protein [Dyadobacter sp. 3J3]|uniref:hypothetical protein n=1 Tax=Dyadobacter sp. 3J3 TaxID=2606600 RepID=UPI001E45B1FF|nr:hypothetical protein [Dyadobacter sp. 3J3]